MTTQTGNKGETRGVASAANALGVSRQHLREVILGRRSSPGLLARFEEWKQSSEAAPVTVVVPIPDGLATMCNLDEYFLESVLGPLGLTVILVVLKAGPDSPALKFPNLGQELGEELKGLGHLDAELFSNGERWFLFHADQKALGQAMTRLKDALAERGLLKVGRIFHIEDSTTATEWWPGTGAAMRVVKEAE